MSAGASWLSLQVSRRAGSRKLLLFSLCVALLCLNVYLMSESADIQTRAAVRRSSRLLVRARRDSRRQDDRGGEDAGEKQEDYYAAEDHNDDDDGYENDEDNIQDKDDSYDTEKDAKIEDKDDAEADDGNYHERENDIEDNNDYNENEIEEERDYNGNEGDGDYGKNPEADEDADLNENSYGGVVDDEEDIAEDDEDDAEDGDKYEMDNNYEDDDDGTINSISPANINCAALTAGDPHEVIKAKHLDGLPKVDPPSYDYYMAATQNCSSFLSERGYIQHAVTAEETSFPLAFSLLMYRDPARAERLLRAVYRPWNHYCIHVDKTASAQTYDIMQAVASCLPGVFLAKWRVNVVRETMSVITPELACMRALLWRPGWRYFINLTGMEFPIKTNLELTQILQAFKGGNDVLGKVTWGNNIRFKWRWINGRVNTWTKNKPAPYNITVAKGSVHMAVTRGYVNYALNEPVAKEFLNWCKTVHVPDEIFFATLNHNPQLGVPGAYIGNISSSNKLRSYVRHKRWNYKSLKQCPGERVRHLVCLVGIRGLTHVIKAPDMFVNKFTTSYEPVAYDCLEEWHRERTLRQIRTGQSDIDVEFYANLPFSRSHVT